MKPHKWANEIKHGLMVQRLKNGSNDTWQIELRPELVGYERNTALNLRLKKMM